jgi:general secretion pathway protein N
MKKFWFIVTGVLAYMIFMAVLTPASVWLKLVPMPPEVQLGKVQGTLWQGQIDVLSRPPVYLTNLRWQLELSALWRGQLGVQLNAGDVKDDSQPYLNVAASVSPGSYALQHATVRWPVAGIMRNLQLPMPVDASGAIVLNINNFTKGEPYCAALDGSASWQQARLKSPIGWLDLRQIDATLSCDQGNLRLVTMPDNPLALAVTADVMAGRYQLNGTLKPDASMPKEVHEAMRFVSQPDAEGRYTIQFGGQIRTQ